MVIKPAAGAVAALALGALAATVPAYGQTTRQKIEQGFADSLCAMNQRVYAGRDCGDPLVVQAIRAIADRVTRPADDCWTAYFNGGTYGALVKCSGNDFPQPVKLAWTGGGGSMGGGGATVPFDPATPIWNNESGNCDELELKSDAGGNLIIPSYKLKTGSSVVLNSGVYHEGSAMTGSPAGTPGSSASSQEASIRWNVHRYNMGKLRVNWVGVVNLYQTGASLCARLATVASGAPGGNTLRSQMAACAGAGMTHLPNQYGSADPEANHKSCPDGGSAGGNFHFYGNSNYGSHFHGCTWFAPNAATMETPDGYAINPVTTIPQSDVPAWPAGLPSFLSQCKIDPALFAKLVDKLFKKATETPGYDGMPYTPVKPEDGRPGDATVGDLNSSSNGDPNTAPTPNPTATPPPSPTPTATATANHEDKCDFGLTGCDNPGTPAPELGEPQTNIMDPIFAWLPDLPSISIPTAGAQCPTWNIDASAFGGQAWAWTMDSHCTLFESNRSAISVVMVALFGLMAAVIILRS